MKIARISLATLLVLIVLQAQTPLRVWRLRLTKHCPGCRLVGVELKNVDLSGANLSHADLRWTRFDTVDLTNADLSGANLLNARMNEVTVLHTEFCSATMMNAVKGYCRQASVSQGDIPTSSSP